VGLRFPTQFIDTFLMAVMVLHATSFKFAGGVYKYAALAALFVRYNLRFAAAFLKDGIRQSILHGTHSAKFGFEVVLEYCLGDARALLELYPSLRGDFDRKCGPRAFRNLTEIYQPYAIAMADASHAGIRLDQDAWGQLTEVAPKYRRQRLVTMGKYGYQHNGSGISDLALARMVETIGLHREWARTPGGQFSKREEDLERYRAHPAIGALLELKRFDAFMNQDLGSLMDRDGRVRCSIQVLKQHTSRNSTVAPNLMGMPGQLRPLLLPDEGHRFVHFDFCQQEPGIAGALSGDGALVADFLDGDVYINLARRLGLIGASSATAAIKAARKQMKVLLLALFYGMSAGGVAGALGVPFEEASAHLLNFRAKYRRTCEWLDAFVAQALQRGWAENIIGYRAAFDSAGGFDSGNLLRSARNFPVQASAAACFQLTGIYLSDMGCDIRLPLHDAYFLQCLNERRAIGELRKQIIVATVTSVKQLFPALRAKREVEVLGCLAKDGNEGSLKAWLESVRTVA